jgi:methyl-accepting chemotaxis protein
MRDVDSKRNRLIPRFPVKMIFFYFAVCLVPDLVLIPLLCFINEFTVAQFFLIFTTPLFFIGLFFCSLFIPFVFFLYCTAGLYRFDGTSGATHSVNVMAKRFEMIHMLYGIANGFFVFCLIIAGCKVHGIAYDLPVLFFTSIGNMFLFALFSYIIFMQIFEAHIYRLPFSRAYKSLPLVIRNTLVALFSCIGVLFSTIAPIFVSRNADMQIWMVFVTKMLPISIYAGVMAIADTYLLMRGINTRVMDITNFTTKLVNRDYTQQYLRVHSRDEFGLLINDLNDFYRITQGLLRAITDSVAISTGSAEDLSDNMTETSASISQIVSNIDSVKTKIVNQATGVEEARTTVDSMVSCIKELGSSIEKETKDVSDSSSAVEEMVQNIRSVTEVLGKNEDAVNNLSNESEHGRQKVEQSVEQAQMILEKSAGLLEASSIIQSIAEQTNLLAMNAAIEAAHAGESGKGFAVVSDEIRKLAEQSNEQGKVISVQLQELQNAIATVSDGTTDVKEQFDVIFKLSDTVKKQEQVVMNAMQEQTAGSTQVLESIRMIRETNNAVQTGADELTNNGRQIEAKMDILSTVTVEINNAMNEMSQGTQTINISVQDVNTASVTNRDNLQKISQEIGKFTLKEEHA